MAHQRLMRLAPVLTCPLIILIHVQTLIRLKPLAWSHQTLILQNFRLILLLTTTTPVIYPARHIIRSMYLLEIFVDHLDTLF